MKNILLKLGFHQQDDVELKISRNEFVNIFHQNIDAEIEYQKNLYSVFNRNITGNQYHGILTGNSFEIKQNFKFGDSQKNNNSKIIGHIIEQEEKLQIKLSVESFWIGEGLFLLLGLIAFCIGAINLITTESNFIVNFIITIGGIITILIVWISSRINARNALYKIQRDLIYFKNKNAS